MDRVDRRRIMYVKITSDNGTGSNIETYGAETIRQVITSQSIYTGSPVAQGMSSISGTGPTSGMYSVSTVTGTTSTGYVEITKHHYSKQQGSTQYTPRMMARYYHDNDYGMRFTLYTYNGANGMPRTNDSHNWTNNTSTTSPIAKMGYQHWNWVSEVHMIINDTTFAFQVITTGSDTGQDRGTFIWNDIEYNSSIDNAAYATNALYCPSVGIWHHITDYAPVDGTAGTDNRNIISRAQYFDSSGVFRNTGISDTSYGWGRQYTANSTYATTEPRPRNRIWDMPSSGGDRVHQLVPVNYMGHYDDTSKYGDPRRGRLMNLYRTSESGFNTGDVIVDGTTRYRVFANCMKAGGGDYNTATHGQSYAFPEDNVPFS